MVAIKLVTVGAAAVGKTAYINRIAGRSFCSSYMCTIGIDFYKDKRTFRNWGFALTTPFAKARGVAPETPLSVLTWDTAGQERFHSISKTYFKGIDGGFLFFDLTCRESFDSLDKWMADMKEANPQAKDLPMVVVGNKRDLRAERVISTAEAMEYASKRDLLYFETSAKTCANIWASYKALIYLVLHSESFIEKSKREPSTIIHPLRKPKSGGCTC